MTLFAQAIYGPPGCGKTTTLMNLITELVSSYGFDSDEIAFVSHTKAAAAEALTRLNLTRSDKVSTIHSLAFRMLNLSSVSLVDHKRLQEFSAAVGVPIKNGLVDSEEGIEVGDEYLAIINKARNRRTRSSEEYYESGNPGSLPQFEMFFRSYFEWKKQNGYIDFTDMLERFVKRAAQGQLPPFNAKVLLVDEAQDLSNLQWEVIDALCGSIERVYIAGDDDQAIYIWGGADPAGMTAFEDRYNASRSVLTQSHRIPRSVQGVALDIINRVGSRVPKEYAPRPEEGRVDRFSYMDSLDLLHGEDTLILCRTGAQKKEMENHLIEQKIPYLNEGGRPGLYQTKVARAIRVFNNLKNGNPVSVAEVSLLTQAALPKWRDAIERRDFASVIKRSYMDVINVPSWNYDFYKNTDISVSPSIRISSIHGSKGREADRVVVHTGLTQRTLESMDKDPDAEARVFYVATTRAKHRLDLIVNQGGFDI